MRALDLCKRKTCGCARLVEEPGLWKSQACGAQLVGAQLVVAQMRAGRSTCGNAERMRAQNGAASDAG